MNRGRTKTVPLFLLLFLAFIPSGGSTPAITEDEPEIGLTTWFDDFTDRTTSTDRGETLGEYTVTGSNFGSFVETANDRWALTAPTTGTAAWAAYYDPATTPEYDVCFDAALDTDSFLSFDFTSTAFPPTTSGAGTEFAVGFNAHAGTSTNGPTVWAAVDQTTTNWAVKVGIDATGQTGTSTQIANSLPLNEIVHIEISDFDCANAAVTFFASWSTGSNGITLDMAGSWLSDELTNFGVGQAASTHDSGSMWVTNIMVVAPTQTPATGDLIFCSDITETGTYPFGYNYKTTGVTAVAVSGSETNNALTFVGEDQVAAKGWSPGTNTIKAYFNVRARSDGETSYFNMALSTVSGTPSAVTFGNGENTQAFADHVRLKMTEGPTYWQGAFYYVSAGGEITGLGPSFTMHEANLFTNYYIIMDTDAADLSIAIYRQQGDSLVAERDLPAAFSGDVIHSQWLIGNDVTASDGQTDLLVGSQLSGSFSTCIYDLAGDGSAPSGSPGSADTQPVEPDEQPGEEEEDPDGLGTTPSADSPIGIIRTNLETGFGMDMGWILGIITVAFIVVYFVGLGVGGLAGAIMIGVAGFLGVGLAVALGFFSVWVLIVIAFIVIAGFVVAMGGSKEEAAG